MDVEAQWRCPSPSSGTLSPSSSSPGVPPSPHLPPVGRDLTRPDGPSDGEQSCGRPRRRHGCRGRCDGRFRRARSCLPTPSGLDHCRWWHLRVYARRPPLRGPPRRPHYVAGARGPAQCHGRPSCAGAPQHGRHVGGAFADGAVFSDAQPGAGRPARDTPDGHHPFGGSSAINGAQWSEPTAAVAGEWRVAGLNASTAPAYYARAGHTMRRRAAATHPTHLYRRLA